MGLGQDGTGFLRHYALHLPEQSDTGTRALTEGARFHRTVINAACRRCRNAQRGGRMGRQAAPHSRRAAIATAAARRQGQSPWPFFYYELIRAGDLVADFSRVCRPVVTWLGRSASKKLDGEEAQACSAWLM